MQVVALIHEEKGVFGASFPDFLGCITVADSLDAIIPKAAEVLAFHVEGMVEDGLLLPPVRTLSQLRKDPIFRTDSAGALIALIPYAPPARATRINITLDESLLERVDRAAEAVGETRSGYLAAAARQRLASDAASSEAAPSYASAALAETGFGEAARSYRPAKAKRTKKPVNNRTARVRARKGDRKRRRRPGREKSTERGGRIA
jgi:predicted RNase H-like HicB family nuclease